MKSRTYQIGAEITHCSDVGFIYQDLSTQLAPPCQRFLEKPRVVPTGRFLAKIFFALRAAKMA